MAFAGEPALDYRSCVVQVEKALVRRLALAYRERLAPVQTRAELRNLDATQRYPFDPVYVQELGKIALWTPATNEPDNDRNTFAPLLWVDPTTNAPLPGRWVLATDEAMYADRDTDQAVSLRMKPSGYLRSVELYQGRPDTDDLWNRFTGRRPLLAVRYSGDTRRLLNATSALYRVEMNFQLIGVSHHPRRGDEALEGSDIPSEFGLDPGLHRILGDADDCTIGQSHPESGYHHLVPGVQKVLPTGHQILQELQSQRLYVGAANITVICGVHRPDYDTKRFTSIGLTTQLVNQHDATALSRDNAVLVGLAVDWPQATLLTAPSAGVAVVSGVRFELAPALVTFAASSDTYRYVTADGAIRYQAVPIGSAAPDTPQGWLLVGKTETDGAGVLYDSYLCTTIFDEDARDIDTIAEGQDP